MNYRLPVENEASYTRRPGHINIKNIINMATHKIQYYCSPKRGAKHLVRRLIVFGILTL